MDRYSIDGIDIEEYFKHHPPDEFRKKLHKKVNDAALEFAKVIMETVNNPRMKFTAINQIQQARMFANQGITIDDLPKEYSVLD